MKAVIVAGYITDGTLQPRYYNGEYGLVIVKACQVLFRRRIVEHRRRNGQCQLNVPLVRA